MVHQQLFGHEVQEFKSEIMWNLGVIIGFLALITIVGFINIRSLIRKMKANPAKKVDLLIGILLWGAAFTIMLFELLKNTGVIIR